jgi:hypothetical protein
MTVSVGFAEISTHVLIEQIIAEIKCDGQEKQERKLCFVPPFLIFNCFSNSIGLT